MTPKDFILWFNGFVKAANGYNVTPKQWEDIVQQLEKVDIENLTKSTSVLNGSITNVTYGRPQDSITYTSN